MLRLSDLDEASQLGSRDQHSQHSDACSHRSDGSERLQLRLRSHLFVPNRRQTHQRNTVPSRNLQAKQDSSRV